MPRPMRLAAIAALLCALLSCSSRVALAASAGGCVDLVGDSDPDIFPLPGALPGPFAVAFGPFATPPLIASYPSYAFSYSVPDQSLFSPAADANFSATNQLRFALYTTTDLVSDTPPLTLVLQSEVVLLDMTIEGPQTVLAAIAAGGQSLQPSTVYYLTVYNQYPYAVHGLFDPFFLNPDEVEYPVDAALGFPALFAINSTLPSLAYPAAFQGCAKGTALSSCSTLLGDDSPADFPTEADAFQAGNIVLAFGTFSTGPKIPSHDNSMFVYNVPAQSMLSVGEQEQSLNSVSPYNQLSFALYVTDQNGDLELVLQSEVILLDMSIPGPQTLVARTEAQPRKLKPNREYYIAAYTELPYRIYLSYDASQNGYADTPAYINATNGFPDPLEVSSSYQQQSLPVAYQTCRSQVVGDPVFTGFYGQRFNVHGLPQRVYNVLSLPSLQLNTRFVPLSKSQAMNQTQQASVRQRQAKLIAALQADAATSLPSTVAWSHKGLYMGETGVQLAGHRLLVQPGAYATGFASVQLDGAELPVSASPVELLDGSTLRRPSSSVLEVVSAAARFTLVNSDHFCNLQAAQLTAPSSEEAHVDGLLGQTADAHFRSEDTPAFQRHIEEDFLLPEGDDDLWSTHFAHNRYVLSASAT